MSEWKMVPVEPTPEMLKAAVQELHPASYWEAAYRAMLSAAPQPEQKPVAWMLKTGHGTKIVEVKPPCEVDLWKPLYLAPQPTEQETDQRLLIQDLAAMCGRMAYALKMKGADVLSEQCLDLLRRKGLASITKQDSPAPTDSGREA